MKGKGYFSTLFEVYGVEDKIVFDYTFYKEYLK